MPLFIIDNRKNVRDDTEIALTDGSIARGE